MPEAVACVECSWYLRRSERANGAVTRMLARGRRRSLLGSSKRAGVKPPAGTISRSLSSALSHITQAT